MSSLSKPFKDSLFELYLVFDTYDSSFIPLLCLWAFGVEEMLDFMPFEQSLWSHRAFHAVRY